MCLGLAQGYQKPSEEKKFSLLKQKTKFDEIKDMNIDEMANFIDDICDNCPLKSANPCDVFALTEWLNSEVSE